MVASTVMVVSNDVASRQELSALLKGMAPKISAVASAAEGLEHLKGQKVALVVCDLSAPEMTNVEFLTACIAIDINLPVVIVTDDTSPINSVKARHLRVRGYLPKPLSVSNLQKVAQQAISMRRLQLSRVSLAGEPAKKSEGQPKAANLSLRTSPIIDVKNKVIWGSRMGIEEPGRRVSDEIYGRALRQLVVEHIDQCPASRLVVVPCSVRDFLSEALSDPEGPLEKYADRIVFSFEVDESITSTVVELKREFASLRRLSFRIMMGGFLDSESTCFAFDMLRPDFISVSSASLRSTSQHSQRTLDLMCQYAEVAGAPIVISPVANQADEDMARNCGFSILAGCHVEFKYMNNPKV